MSRNDDFNRVYEQYAEAYRQLGGLGTYSNTYIPYSRQFYVSSSEDKSALVKATAERMLSEEDRQYITVDVRSQLNKDGRRAYMVRLLNPNGEAAETYIITDA